MIRIKNNNKEKDTKEIITKIYEKLDYSLSYEDRVSLIENINKEYGEKLQEYYIYYKTSNLNKYENKDAYSRICNVYDKMSEYILFSDYSRDEFKENGQNTYTFTQESNLKTMQSKDEVSYNQYVHLINNADNLEKIKYDDQNHATYTLKDFESKMNECPYVHDYYEFNKNARRVIEKLDKQLQNYEELKEECSEIGIECDIPLLVYENKRGKKYYFTPQHLNALKKGIGYNKNNSKEIDKDIMAIYREYFKPIYFKSITRNQEMSRKMDLDFMDREHVVGLIKASCLIGQSQKFDDYIEKLDRLAESANLTELEKQVYNTLGKGKGLDLEKSKYEDNMITISECARIIGRTQSKIDEVFNSLVGKIMNKYEEQYEDYYFTFIARGTYKTCSKCNEVKLANERYFRKHTITKDGFQSQCRKCEQIADKLRKSKDF